MAAALFARGVGRFESQNAALIDSPPVPPLSITPLTTKILASVDPHLAGAVSATPGTMQQVGDALGVAVSGTIVFGALDGGMARGSIRSCQEPHSGS